jgi:hypothetical protein
VRGRPSLSRSSPSALCASCSSRRSRPATQPSARSFWPARQPGRAGAGAGRSCRARGRRAVVWRSARSLLARSQPGCAAPCPHPRRRSALGRRALGALAAELCQAARDGQRDRVGVEGTNDVDHIVVGGSSGAVAVSGLASVVRISGAEFLNDTLAINTLARADTVDTSPLAPEHDRAVGHAVRPCGGGDTVRPRLSHASRHRARRRPRATSSRRSACA